MYACMYVYICMCVCMYVCMCVCMYVCITIILACSITCCNTTCQVYIFYSQLGSVGFDICVCTACPLYQKNYHYFINQTCVTYTSVFLRRKTLKVTVAVKFLNQCYKSMLLVNLRNGFKCLLVNFSFLADQLYIYIYIYIYIHIISFLAVQVIFICVYITKSTLSLCF